MSKGYMERSFHGYGLKLMLRTDEYETRASLSEEVKLAVVGMKLFMYLDRLAYAEYDISRLLRSLDQLVTCISCASPAVAGLDMLRGRLAELRELVEGSGAEDDERFISLSRSFFTGLIEGKRLLRENGLDSREYVQGVQQVADAIVEMAERLDYLALRHFYVTVKRGEYQTLAAICMGSGFLSTIARLFSVYITEADRPEAEAARGSFFDTEYNMAALCSLGTGFDIRRFDDETNPLLPEVVDRLSWPGDIGAEG